jgi:sulfur dioxygenase
MTEPFLFRQLFERNSSTYSYLLASRKGGEALIIDPVREETERYLQLLRELDIRLVFAIDTHLHADHVTALGTLREQTACVTVMGAMSKAACVSRTVTDGELLKIDGLELFAMATPGHTDDSFSFVMQDRVFTGDTLLFRGTGRTDFQNGNPGAQYDSLFGKILKLSDDTKVYPAHDYKGWTESTIGEEKAHNPRLQVRSREAYVAQMQALKLPSPALMDIAVPANLTCGIVHREEDGGAGI